MIEGVITVIAERLAGSELAADASAGATTIYVVDPDEFDADGGVVEIGSEGPSYTSCNPDTGETALKVGLLGSYSEGEPVIVTPHHIERYAYLREHGSEEELEAIVPHNLYEKLAVGTRDFNTGELVECEQHHPSGELRVKDVVAKSPSADSSFLDTASGSSKSIDGLPLTSVYQALDGEITVSPEEDSLCVVEWGCPIRLFNDAGGARIQGAGFASLLLDGAPTGLERYVEFTGKFDEPGPSITFAVSGGTAIAMEAGIDHDLAVGVKGGMVIGSAEVPAGKNAGLSFNFYGG